MTTPPFFRVGVIFALLVTAFDVCLAWQTSAPSSVPAKPPAAQSEPAIAPPKPVSAPEPISITMIPGEAEVASVRLRSIKIETDRAFRLGDAGNRLKDLTESVRRFRPVMEADILPHEDELLNLRQDMRRVRLQIVDLQTILTPRSQLIEARREELRNIGLTWQATYDALNRQETPVTTRELIRSVQKEIQSALDAINASRPALLTLQSRTSELRIEVDNLLVQADQAINDSRAQLFAIDSRPLWSSLAQARLSSLAEGTAQSFYQRHALPMWDYLRDEKQRLWAHLLISVLLVLVFRAISRRSRKWFGEIEGADRMVAVLQHPVAAAMLLSLLLSFELYPNAPLTLYRLPPLLMVVPLLQLLSGSLARDERNTMYFLTALYILRCLDDLVAPVGLLHRALLLIMAAAALSWICGVAKKDHQQPAKKLGPWRRIRKHLATVWGLLLVGSLIANLVGSVSLATLLVGGCIGSAFAGAALFAGALILESYLAPLLRSPLARVSLAVQKHSGMIHRRISLLIRLLALAVWAAIIATLFGISGPMWDLLSPFWGRRWAFGQTTFSIGGIFIFVVTIWLSALAARLLGFILREDILPRMSLPQGVPTTLSMLVRYGIVAFGVILALAGAGVQWGQIALVAGAIGVGVGLGLQNLVASFVAGLILIFERPIRVGDVVEVGKIFGVVTRIGMRSSTIETFDMSEVFCPNSNLISQDLVNWTLSNQVRRVEVRVSTAYGTNPETVLAVLIDVAQKQPGVLRNPDPMAIFLGFGESSLNFSLRFFCSFNDSLLLSSQVGIRINDAFSDAGIVIPFPQRDIRITSEPRPAYRQPAAQA